MSPDLRGLCGPRWPLLAPLMLLLLVGRLSGSEPPQQLLCVNTDCTGVISSATTLMKYRNPDSFLLPFNANVKVRVLGKPKDPKDDYWAVELNGVYGFVPKSLLREGSILTQPKKIVDVKHFLTITETLNRDNLSASKKEIPVDEENEDDFQNDPPEELVNDPTKPPSHKNKKTEQYYREKRYLEKEKRYKKYRTENLEMLSTTENPIISSTLPDSNTNVDDIHATQSTTVIDGTTFYPYSIDSPENTDEKQSSDFDAKKDNLKIESKKEEIQITPASNVQKDTLKPESEEVKLEMSPYLRSDEVDNVSETPRKSPKVAENEEEAQIPDSDPQKDILRIESEKQEIQSTPDSDVQNDILKPDSEKLEMFPVDNVMEISQKLPEVAENEDETSSSDSQENFLKESIDILNSGELSQTIHDDNSSSSDENLLAETDENKITQSNIDNSSDSQETFLKEASKESIDTLNSGELSQTIHDDNSNSSNENLLPETDENKMTQSNIDNSSPPLKTIENQNDISSENTSTETTTNLDADEDIKVEDVEENVDDVTENKYNHQNEQSNHNENLDSNIEIASDIKNEFSLDSNTSEEAEIISNIEEPITNLENDTVDVDNLNNIDSVSVDGSEIEIQSQSKSEYVKPAQDFENFNNYSHIDETIKINETINDNIQTDVENENVSDVENSTNMEIPLSETPPFFPVTSHPPFEEPITEETIIDSGSPNLQNIQSETATMKHNEFWDNYEPQLPLDTESTTVTYYEPQVPLDTNSDTTNSDIFDNEKEIVEPENVADKQPINYEDTINDDIQQPNLLDSDIENEKSFFFSPLTLLNNVYQSISNIIKSNDISNTIEKSNTNIFNSEEIQSNDYQQFENSDHSQKYMSVLTEKTQCSSEEKSMPRLSDISTDFIFWLVISSVSALMFTLGYYYLENRKQDGKLLAMVNTLQKELLCSSKECILLKEELTVTKDKLMGIEDSSFGSNEMVVCLKKELADNQITISELQEKLIATEEELGNSTEAALELQSILDEQLSAKDTSSSSLAFTITNLQSQLDDQQATMNLTKAQLASKVEENELLLLKMMDVNNKCTLIEKQLSNAQDSLQQAFDENNSKSLQLQELASNLEKSLLQAETQRKSEVRELQQQIKDLKDELNANKTSLKARSHELQTLQENIKTLQTDEKNISAILNDGHTKAELVKITSEKNLLTEKFEAESVHMKELNKMIEDQDSKLSEMKEKLSEADQKTLEATTRLEVLTNYFNQKEADLLKELSTKESLWMSQQGEAMSTVEKIQALQQEIQQHKDTAESIRREVVEQEAAWRAKVAALEQRAHEHWLARRAAERSAEASAREAQTLRQRLAAPSPDKRVVSPLTTGEILPDSAFLPPLGMLPPPPLGFLPPPLGGPMLLPPPLPPHRPPPLGRLSSPPPLQPMRPDRSYSPDSRYSPERAYSPQNRGRSPLSNSESRRRTYNNNRRYDNRYYDSEEDRRSRRYETETDFSPVNTLPPSPIPNSRPHKGSSKFDNSDYSQ